MRPRLHLLLSAFSMGPLLLVLWALLGLTSGRALADPPQGRPFALRDPAPELSVGILGLDAVEVPEATAQAVTDVLRQRAARMPGIRIMPGSKELVELKLIFGCMDENPACLAVAGKSLGADRLLYGSVRRAPGGPGYTVVLKQLDVRKGQVDRFISDVMPVSALEGKGIELSGLVRRWLDVLLLSELHGGLRITSEPDGAEVVLDGTPIGKTPIELKNVPTGSHMSSISYPGYAQAVRTFEVKGGLLHEMTVTLGHRWQHDVSLVPVPHNADSGHNEHNDLGRPFKLASYFLVGAAAIAGGVAIYTWRTYSGDETAARSALDVLQMNLPGASADVNAFLRSPDRLSSCNPPHELGAAAQRTTEGTMAYQEYLDRCQHGNTYAGATTGLVATMGSLALLGVVSYIIGERKSHGGEKTHPDDAYSGRKEQRSSWLYTPKLRAISPVIGRSGGGVDLSFQF